MLVTSLETTLVTMQVPETMLAIMLGHMLVSITVRLQEHMFFTMVVTLADIS